MMRLSAPLCALLCCMLLFCACPQQKTRPAGADGAGSSGSPTAAGTDPVSGDAALEEESGPDATGNQTSAALTSQQMQAPRQLVILYSGNTHARLIPTGFEAYGNLTGGLSALAAEITAAEQEIVQYNRMRVANNGGDPSTVRVELDQGLIGDHPFLLLDYGGWYNPDLLETPQKTGLMLEAFSTLHYSAVALRDWQLMDAAELQLLAGMAPTPLLLNTPGTQPGDLPAVSRLLVREVLGEDWAVVSLPRLAVEDREDYDRQIMLLLDECAREVEISGARHCILLAADQTGSVYRELATDTRFDVVIGAPGAMSCAEGFGRLPEDGPLLLPHLTDGGTELGHANLIWEAESENPVNFFFERRIVADDGSEHLPFRKRISEMTREINSEGQ